MSKQGRSLGQGRGKRTLFLRVIRWARAPCLLEVHASSEDRPIQLEIAIGHSVDGEARRDRRPAGSAVDLG